MKHTLVLAFAALMTLLSSQTFASGGYGGGGGGYSGGTSLPQRQVDQTYEVGKSIYLGRQSGVDSLSYCVMVEGEKKPVRRSTLRPYKGTSYNELAQNLYNCDEPDQKVAERLSRDNFLYVVYYLNKRHNLKLRGS